MDYTLLGQRLRQARTRAQMSQTDAAQFIEVTSAALNQYESGKRKLDALTLERLARLYGVPVRSLFSHEETVTSEWEEGLQLCAQNVSANSKAGIRRLIEKIAALEELYTHTQTPYPGSPHSPLPAIADTQLGATHIAIWAAQKARSYYNLGIAPLSNLREFLAAQGFLIFLIPFGKEETDLSGIFLLHPKLGEIAALNENQRDHFCFAFRLAHAVAHKFYQHDRLAMVCPPEDSNLGEKFAAQFALYFLIPSEALLERLHFLNISKVQDPADVIHLCRYFGVSYHTMLCRLKIENYLVGSPKNFHEINPEILALRLGYSPANERNQIKQRFLDFTDRFPRILIELVYRAIAQDQLSIRNAAEMLGISDFELEEHFNFDGVEQLENKIIETVNG